MKLARSPILSSLSLRAKLLLANLAVVALALSLMMAIVAAAEWRHAKKLLHDDARTQARILGETAGAALVFADRRAASDILRSLRLSPNIRDGALLTADHAELARYRRDAVESPPTAEVRGPHHAVGDGALLEVSEPVSVDEQVVGYVVLQSDKDAIWARVRWAAIATTSAAVLALAAAILLSRRLRDIVAGPILRLAQVAQEISACGDYSRRATVEGKDEVAALARDFNAMIGQIERHNKALIRELERRRRVQARLDHLAHFDPLTGLPNRRHFQKRIETAISFAAQVDETVSIMFIDLDNFKYVNDTLGHDIGDELLRHVARVLQASLRANDIVCRLGGDEFAVIVQGDAADAVLARVATKLIDALAPAVQLAKHNVQVGCSVGIARYPADCGDAEALLRAADAAMYHAKESGKNTFRFFHQQLQERAERRLCLEIALREAVLAEREILLHYQPVWSVAAERIVAVEALCRWQHPEHGSIPPEEFIHIAEESDLILRLGAWVLRTACAQGASWQRGDQPLLVAVNVSGRQFREPGFFDEVCRILDETALSPHLLEIEVTESVLMEGFDDLAGLFGKLRQIGVRIALDDFGTGFSSLSYLKRLPLDKLKIDKSFVRDLPHDSDDRSITRAIVALAHSLDLQIQAEGVENKQQMDYLTLLGCEYIQGYYLARPLTLDNLAALRQAGDARPGLCHTNDQTDLASLLVSW